MHSYLIQLEAYFPSLPAVMPFAETIVWIVGFAVVSSEAAILEFAGLSSFVFAGNFGSLHSERHQVSPIESAFKFSLMLAQAKTNIKLIMLTNDLPSKSSDFYAIAC